MYTSIAKRLTLLLVLGIPYAGLAEEVPGDPVRGASLYSNNCGRCHNLRAPNELGDQQWSIVVAHMRVVAGLPGDQARDIQAFLYRSNNPVRPSLPDVGAGPPDLSGAQLIESNACRGCHVIGGQGGSVGPALDTLFERREEKWIREQIKNPRGNNPRTVMPAMGLSEAEITAVLEELRRIHPATKTHNPPARANK